jgi:hypothetical protein
MSIKNETINIILNIIKNEIEPLKDIQNKSLNKYNMSLYLSKNLRNL